VTDLVIFVGIVGLVVVVGILVGMIVAGRIDRIIAPRPAGPAPEGDPSRGGPGHAADTTGVGGPLAIDPVPQQEERP